jgi:hypothetical protein
MEKGMTTAEVAKRCGKNSDTVNRWILLGVLVGRGNPRVRLSATRNGGRWSISEADLLEFQEACRAEAVVDDLPEPKPKRRRPKEKSRERRLEENRKALEAMGY